MTDNYATEQAFRELTKAVTRILNGEKSIEVKPRVTYLSTGFTINFK